AFTIQRVGRAAAMFDDRKLAFLDAFHLRSLSPEALLAACHPALAQAGFLPAPPLAPDVASWAGSALQTFAGQMETLADAPAALRPLMKYDDHMASPDGVRAFEALGSEPSAREVIRRFGELAASRAGGLPDKAAFREVASAAGAAAGVKGRALFHPLRL